MKRHVEEKELPYFAATLTAYLRESHPELLPDKHFIAERSDHAAQTYERAVRNGNSVYEALELSNAVLYQDLRFSKYDAIFEVVSEWFPEVAARQRTAFCLKLLPVCEEVFEMYDLTDDFESSPSYKNLLLELTGLIQPTSNCMAYNKRKHLEANIAALRIAFASPAVLSPQQRDALAAYSGFGALKCVLQPAAADDDLTQ